MLKREIERLCRSSSIKSFILLSPVLLGVSGALAQSASLMTRTSGFDYDANGQLIRTITEPGSALNCLVTEFTRNAKDGQVETSTVRNCDPAKTPTTPNAPREATATATGDAAFAPRATGTTYSTDRRFVASTTNALNQFDQKVYDARFGGVVQTTGPNGLKITQAYDEFGRQTGQMRPGGFGSRTSYDLCSGVNGGTLAACPTINGAPAKWAITNTPLSGITADATGKLDFSKAVASGPYMRVYFDSLGREIRTETQGFDGNGTSRLVYVDTRRNALGDVTGKSQAYFAGDSALWTTTVSDVFHRTKEVDAPYGSGGTAVVTTAYHGLTTIVTSPKPGTASGTISTTQVRNAAGQVASIVDASGGSISRDYDAFGAVVRSTDPLRNVISAEYDSYGHKLKSYDPDMGVWTFSYDPLGQIRSQTGPRILAQGQVQRATFTYDVLGRLIARSDPDLDSAWFYDKPADQGSGCGLGVGKLCEEKTGSSYDRLVVYDSLGRAKSSTSSIRGTSYVTTLSYDPTSGQPSAVGYPDGFGVAYAYTPLGYLKSVSDAQVDGNGVSREVFWSGSTLDASARATEYKYNQIITTDNTYFDDGRLKTSVAGTAANSGGLLNLAYTYDKAGDLSTRIDLAAASSPIVYGYAYDALARLTSETRSGGNLASGQTMSWTYDAIGNITSQSDSAVFNGQLNTYNYNTSGSGSNLPHAVASVSGYVDGLPSARYAYDAGGNMTSSAGRTVAWTSFDMAQSIARNGTQLDYLYDGDHERALETYSLNGVQQRQTVYINPAAGTGLFYERETGVAGDNRKYYITAGSRTIGVRQNRSGVWSTQYWYKDQIDSNVATSDGNGLQVERLNYEPFGKRRAAAGATDVRGTLIASSTDRGFGEHEELDEVGLVNMNGRIYDASLGRFLSADPGVTHSGMSQSYNRYSYAENNPFGYIDPSGFDPWWNDFGDGEGQNHELDSYYLVDGSNVGIAYHGYDWTQQNLFLQNSDGSRTELGVMNGQSALGLDGSPLPGAYLGDQARVSDIYYLAGMVQQTPGYDALTADQKNSLYQFNPGVIGDAAAQARSQGRLQGFPDMGSSLAGFARMSVEGGAGAAALPYLTEMGVEALARASLSYPGMPALGSLTSDGLVVGGEWATYSGAAGGSATVAGGGAAAGAGAGEIAAEQAVDLTADRAVHILNRHMAGAGIPGKTEFPLEWSDRFSLHQISDVATDPASLRTTGKWDTPIITGTRYGVDIRVDLYPPNHPTMAGKISTGYPTNVPANPSGP